MFSDLIGLARFLATGAAIAVAGCTAGSVSGDLLSLPPEIAQTLGRDGISQAHHIRDDISWVDPTAKHSDLLYISDEGSNAVYIYSWPQSRLVGKLANISYPQGECANAAGDVFFTSVSPPYGSYVFKYRHGAIKSLMRVDDPGFFASGCAVDPRTGNIAVTNLETFKFYYGSLNLYTSTGKMIAQYGNGNLLYYFFCGYDARGNLYVDGAGDYNPFDVFQAAELPAGSNQLTIINLNQTIDFPGGVQAHGRAVAIGDRDQNVVYEFSINGSTGTKIGTTSLLGGKQVLQFWIEGHRIIGPSAGTRTVRDWPFPGGGTGVRIGSRFTDPVGAAISVYR